MAASRFINRVNADALLRFGPELSALKQMLASSQIGYRQQVHAAQAGAAGIQAASAAGLQQLKGIYPDAAGGIPGLSRAQALTDMVDRGVRAQESAAGARRSAATQLNYDRSRIGQRQTDIAQELGAFRVSDLGSISDKAAQRDLQNRISLRTDATRQSEGAANRQNARTVARIRTAGKGTPSATAAKIFEDKFGVKPQTQVQHNALRSKVDSALAIVKSQIAAGSSRKRTASLLVNGRPAIKGTSTSGQAASLPAIPKIDPYVASLALDLGYDSHVSNRNARETHRRGYSVKALGLPNKAPASSLASSLAAAIGA